MTTMTPIRSDAETQRDVLQELKWDPRVDQSEVGVQVKDGIVMLTGHVKNYAKRLAAEEAAHRVHGVLDVVNDMEVFVPSAFRRSDEDIAKAVRSTLQWDVFVPDEQIRSTVSDGYVTLEGDVSTLSQKYDANDAIARLAGVKGVINRIHVKAPPASTREIRDEIEQALERQAEREAKRLSISVEDGGVVTLGGTVRSWAERRAAEAAARFARGVTRVDDQLRVDPYVYL